MAKDGVQYDFGGYATRFNVKCADGRTIRPEAFAAQDGQRVTLADSHGHSVGSDAIGFVDLQLRHDGMYCYGSLNNTEKGRNSKEALRHGDVDSLSIWANGLTQTRDGDVVHGVIREVSLVMSGCNPGANIDTISLSHGAIGPNDFLQDSEAIITPFENDYVHIIEHSGTEEETDTHEEENKSMANSDPKQIWESMTPEQQKLCQALVAKALQDGGAKENKEDDDMPKQGTVSHNAFEASNYAGGYGIDTLCHDAFADIIGNSKASGGSVREWYLAHGADISAEYGVENLNLLLEDYHQENRSPEKIRDRELGWVDKVVDGAHESLFSMRKNIYADLRDEESMKARGYITTHRKKETAFKLLKRTTNPWTIYIKAKMNRDQLIDLEESGLDYVPFVKEEMQQRMKELKALCYLLGDGLSSADEDHVPEDMIRPIVSDDALYSRKIIFNVKSTDDDEARIRAFIKQVRKQRRKYKGTGTPSLFIPEGLLEDMLNLEKPDSTEYLYEDEAKLCRVLRVKEIIPVDAMVGKNMIDNEPESDTNGESFPLWAIMVNMADYGVGMNKMGRTALFEDFDIDYNQQKWLYETRQSGSLDKAFSALVFGMNVVSA